MTSRNKSYPLHQSPFYKLRRRDKLARLLGLDRKTLKLLAASADNFYKEFEVDKKVGEKRPVQSPDERLKSTQRTIANILSRIAPPDYLFCPVKGRCYVTNAARHRGQRVVRCLDVRRYFPSTSFERVLWFFRTVMHCSIDVAWILAKLATYRGYLPTGSPLSPIMAFFAHYDVWNTISEICNKNGYTLTVYIDDVTISGTNVSAKVLWEIKKAIHGAGLRYHKEKSYVGKPAEITGVIVRGNELVVPNRQLQKLARAREDARSATDVLARKIQIEKMTGLNGQVAQIRKANRLQLPSSFSAEGSFVQS